MPSLYAPADPLALRQLIAAVALRCTPEPDVLWGMAGSGLVIAIPALWLVRH